MTDPSLLDPPATVVDRRGHTHLANGCSDPEVDGPRRPGTIGEIDCRDCRILAKVQHARGEHPRGDAMTRWSYEETFDYVKDVVEQALVDAGGPWRAEQVAVAAEAAADVLADGVDLGRPIQTVDTGGRL